MKDVNVKDMNNISAETYREIIMYMIPFIRTKKLYLILAIISFSFAVLNVPSLIMIFLKSNNNIYATFRILLIIILLIISGRAFLYISKEYKIEATTLLKQLNDDIKMKNIKTEKIIFNYSCEDPLFSKIDEKKIHNNHKYKPMILKTISEDVFRHNGYVNSIFFGIEGFKYGYVYEITYYEKSKVINSIRELYG